MKREEELTVSVKALEWTPYGAETPFGWYEITDQRDAVNPSELRRRMPFLLCASRTKHTRHETFEAAQAAAQSDFEARIRSVLISTPKPEPVGWETDAEWDLEMRCANITENTPFAEVSKLINDLWQQYCLAAEPKPEATEGGAHEKRWQLIETAPKDGSNILAWADYWGRFHIVAWNEEEGYWCDGSWCFTSGPTHWMPVDPPAITAKQTDGREV